MTTNLYGILVTGAGRRYSALWNGSLNTAIIGSVPQNEGWSTNATADVRASEVRYEPFSAAINLDVTPPALLVQVPSNGVFYTTNTLTTLSGTAVDPTPDSSGIRAVYTQIKRTSDSLCWNGTSGLPAANNWIACGPTISSAAVFGAPTWSTSIVVANQNNVWTDGQAYVLTSSAVDISGNASLLATVNFSYDITPATAIISVPISTWTGTTQGYYQRTALGTFSGTAQDQVSPLGGTPSGLTSASQIQLTLKNTTAGNPSPWWNGEAWQAAQTFFAPTTYSQVSKAWSYTMPAPTTNLLDLTTYQLSIQVADLAQNYMAQATTATFVTDESVPILKLSMPNVIQTPPAFYQLTSFPGIQGTAKDPDLFFIAISSISIFNPGVGSCWDGAAFTKACPFWITIPGANPASWTYPFTPISGSSLAVSIISANGAGVPSAVFTNSFIVDSSTPTSTQWNPREPSLGEHFGPDFAERHRDGHQPQRADLDGAPAHPPLVRQHVL